MSFSYVSRGIGSGGAWPVILELWVMACSWTDSAHGQTVSQAVLRYPSSDRELCVEVLDGQGLFPRSPNSLEVPVVVTVSIQSG